MAPRDHVEYKTSFDKDPRLANGRGFFYTPSAAILKNGRNYEQND
jgi:hypothetical protein